jgi:hypothetical protein
LERNLVRHYEGEILMLPLVGLHVTHAVQRGIWVPTQHLLWDQGKPRKTLIQVALLLHFTIYIKLMYLLYMIETASSLQKLFTYSCFGKQSLLLLIMTQNTQMHNASQL